MITSLDSGRSGEASGETVEQPAMSQVISALAPERKLIFHPQCFRCVLGKFRGGVRGIPFRVITQILPFWSSGGAVKPGICCTVSFLKPKTTISWHFCGKTSPFRIMEILGQSTHLPPKCLHLPTPGASSINHTNSKSQGAGLCTTSIGTEGRGNGRTVAAVW